MKIICLLTLALCCSQLKAQDSTHNRDRNYWSIGINPFGIIEPESNAGPCFSYRLSAVMELWSETSLIFDSYNTPSGWHHLSGYRFIFQPRFYITPAKDFFVAAEFRLKHYRYNTTGNFINKAAGDTLPGYHHTVSQSLPGGALLIGAQAVLSRRHQIFLEITAGIGGKLRKVKRLDVPGGYTYFDESYLVHRGFRINYETEGWLVYMPLGIRVICKL